MNTVPSHRQPRTVFLAVVDDNTFFRECLGQAGTLPAHQHVVVRAENAPQLAESLTDLPDRRCDVVLLDLRTSGRPLPDPMHPETLSQSHAQVPVQGAAAVELLLRASSDAVDAGLLTRIPAILVYTQETATFVHIACLAAGASGVVGKDEPLEHLGRAIDAVAAGELIVGESTAGVIELLATRKVVTLSDAEASVVALTAHGHRRAEIAGDLFISEGTVDKHLRSVRDKFGALTNLTDLADAFGLRDLAIPSSSLPRPGRRHLASLVRKLGRRDPDRESDRKP